VKPKNTFDTGLFWRNERAERLRAGSTLPQGWVRPAIGSAPVLSDDALGLEWALIGVGVDPTAYLRADRIQRWQRAGGKVWQWCQRSQALHLAAAHQRLEALDETLLPRRVPLGWSIIVRPDRCIMAEGPIEQVETMLEQALQRIEPASDTTEALGTAWHTSSTTSAA
jgi:3-(3-hydroxy-phenyl)propionate hydroxylase